MGFDTTLTYERFKKILRKIPINEIYKFICNSRKDLQNMVEELFEHYRENTLDLN